MKHLMSYLLPLGTLLLSDTSLGQKQNMFLLKYKEPIQNYIMTGHDKGWKQCDYLSDGITYEGAPHIAMELDKIKTLDTKSTFASSHCLLVTYHVGSNASLSSLLEFGRKTFFQKRLALVLKLDSGITLDMATNVTKLPFLVAAESTLGKVQFLCPVVGERDLRLEQKMCKPSYNSYKNTPLRVCITGIPPYVNYDGKDGIDLRLLTYLAQRLNVNPKIIYPPSFEATSHMVCSLHLGLSVNELPRLTLISFQSRDRDSDLTLTRWNYGWVEFQTSDYIGPLDTYDYHFISAAPSEISGYLALIRVFDPPSWAWTLASVLSVTIALVTINHWSNMSPKETAYQRKISPKVKFLFLIMFFSSHYVWHGS